MLTLLRFIFVFIILAMLAGTFRATLEESLLNIPQYVTGDPWFQVTLLDTYFGFFFFWLWVAFREKRFVYKLLWFFLIAGLGNMAMAVYALLATKGLENNDPHWAKKFLLGRLYNEEEA